MCLYSSFFVFSSVFICERYTLYVLFLFLLVFCVYVFVGIVVCLFLCILFFFLCLF